MEHQNSKKPSNANLIASYLIIGVIFTIIIGIFSLFMAGIASYRNGISEQTYTDTELIYNGPISQSAPTLRSLEEDSSLYKTHSLTRDIAQKYLDNTSLKSTDGKVEINANFVKKGLVYQPTYQTTFQAVYILRNDSQEKSIVTFLFPFPVNVDSNEITNAILKVNGITIQNAKSKVNIKSSSYLNNYTNYYYDDTTKRYVYELEIDGLKSDVEIASNSSATIEVSYDTVGLSYFTYTGIENSKGAQDFNFELTIHGTRSYNVPDGLSPNTKEFGDGFVKLNWTKPNLISTPLIKVTVGDKINPSEQVSRVYLTMAPIYIVFISIILYLAYKFAKKLSLFDMCLVSTLFAIYFPFFHYLSSFAIDPTMEIYSVFKQVNEFSMPLYGAFIISWIVISGLIYYLLGKISGFKFATKLGIPTLVLFLGFFPLVVTIPEYSLLLVLIGTVALIAIIVQVRINLMQKE